eukprot:5257471-Prymnesium_polylepis.2
MGGWRLRTLSAAAWASATILAAFSFSLAATPCALSTAAAHTGARTHRGHAAPSRERVALVEARWMHAATWRLCSRRCRGGAVRR